MAWNGSGTFNPLAAPVFPAVAGDFILASRFNSVMNDIYNGLGNVVCRDGQNVPSANLPMGNFRHTGVADGVNPTDYASLGQVNLKAALAGANFTGAVQVNVSAQSNQIRMSRTTSSTGAGWIGANSTNMFQVFDDTLAKIPFAINQAAVNGALVLGSTGLTLAGMFTASSSSGSNGTMTSNGQSAGTNGDILFQIAGVSKAQLGVVGTAGNMVGGSLVGDFVIRSMVGAGVYISGDSGTTKTLSVTSTGLAVTGSFSTTGKITSTVGNNLSVFESLSATTGYQYIRLANTSGGIVFGVEGSVIGGLIAGDTAYDGCLYAVSGLAFSADNGSNMQMRVSSTGVAINGQAVIKKAGSPLVINTTSSASIDGLIVLQRSGTAKGYIGLDASDVFALLDSAGTSRQTITTSGISVTGTYIGSGTITGTQHLSTSSSAALPAFSVSTGTGIYNNGANTVGISCNSANVVNVTTTGAAVTGNLTSTTDCTFNGLTVGAGGGGSSTNTSLGRNALLTNSTGTDLTAVGNSSLKLSTGSRSTGCGSVALTACSTGNDNTAFGYGALTTLTTASFNTAVGSLALRDNLTATNNTAIGATALLTSTGGANTGLGYGAGSNIVAGQNNTCVGDLALSSTASVNNEITLGNSSVTSLRCQVTSITALSDARDKVDIVPLSNATYFIDALRPVSFTWNTRDGAKVGIPDMGFIAQELKQAQLNTGIQIPNLVYETNPEKMEAAYGTLLPMMVRAIQELSAEVKELKKQLAM